MSVAKYAIYTALFGNYDVLCEPVGRFLDIDFICFTDQSIESDLWHIVRIDCDGIEPNLRNRELKWHPQKYLKEYKASIYIDANIKVKGDVLPLLEECLSQDSFWACKHPFRSTVISEGLACIVYGKSGFGATLEQMAAYYGAGFSDAYQLSSNCILIRSHKDNQINALMESVFMEVNKFTGRDQLALPFCAWQANRAYSLMAVNYLAGNGVFQWVPHREYATASFSFKLRRKIRVGLLYLLVPVPYYLKLGLKVAWRRVKTKKSLGPL